MVHITASEAVAQQRAWMEQCGGDLDGYIRRYGLKDDPEHYGDGGAAIYAADLAFLERLCMEERLEQPIR